MQILQVKTQADFNAAQVPAGKLLVWLEVNDGNATYHCKDENGVVSQIGGGSSELPVVTLGTSGTQTIDRSVSDKFIIPPPTGAITLPLSGFTTDKPSVLLKIINGGINIGWAGYIKWDKTDALTPPTLQTNGYDIIRLYLVDDGKYIGEHVGTYNASPVTSYDNTGGMGNRTSLITMTATITVPNYTFLIDGSYAGANFYDGNVAGKYFQFEFPQAVYIDEFRFMQDNTGSNNGYFKWLGSNNGVDFTDISSEFNMLSNTNTSIDLINNSYTIYRLLGISGGTNYQNWTFEMEFKIYGLA
jgi:hypothetical protein